MFKQVIKEIHKIRSRLTTKRIIVKIWLGQQIC